MKIEKALLRKRRRDRARFKRAHKGRNPRDRHMKPSTEPKIVTHEPCVAWKLGDRANQPEV